MGTWEANNEGTKGYKKRGRPKTETGKEGGRMGKGNRTGREEKKKARHNVGDGNTMTGRETSNKMPHLSPTTRRAGRLNRQARRRRVKTNRLDRSRWLDKRKYRIREDVRKGRNRIQTETGNGKKPRESTVKTKGQGEMRGSGRKEKSTGDRRERGRLRAKEQEREGGPRGADKRRTQTKEEKQSQSRKGSGNGKAKTRRWCRSNEEAKRAKRGNRQEEARRRGGNDTWSEGPKEDAMAAEREEKEETVGGGMRRATVNDPRAEKGKQELPKRGR
ncbi:hypothetical protein HNY73_021953 [Argiope bruennichi]|uniref:Uncharacterized protein n=1 Tax=Argiope bruennichi TaxID=94029 RepID=A0A8T0E3G7_ARGBR|nr:hypothetical protein HNY73_021953 [Argiope bruennichi]